MRDDILTSGHVCHFFQRKCVLRRDAKPPSLSKVPCTLLVRINMSKNLKGNWEFRTEINAATIVDIYASYRPAVLNVLICFSKFSVIL